MALQMERTCRCMAARNRKVEAQAPASRGREKPRALATCGRAMQDIGARRLARINPDELEPHEARRFLMDGSSLEQRGFETVLEHAAEGRQSQVNVQINIDSDHARRVIELHESRRQLESEVLNVAQENERGDS